MCSNFSRKICAKKLLDGKGKSVPEQRSHRRQRLFEQFKYLRIQTVDRFRNIHPNDITYEYLFELRTHILSTLNSKELLDVEDLSKLLEDLEQEMTLLQCEQYEKQYEEEIESITDNLMNKCDICENFILQNGLCQLCTQKHFNSHI